MKPRKLDNFSRALRNLEGSQSYFPPYDAVTEAGLVALFELCFDLAWKAMKDALESEGYSEAQTGSPRKIVKCAYAAGMIDDEETWLDALGARNLLSHTYNDKIALEIIQKTREKYLPLFQVLELELKANW